MEMGPLTESERLTNQARAQILKAIAHPTRIFIVDKLQYGPRSVLELTQMIGVDMSTVSRHLAILKSAAILTSEREGTTIYYSLACPCVRSFLEGVEVVLQHSVSQQAAALGQQANRVTTKGS